MIGRRLEEYRDRARRDLVAAFREEHTSHEVASSFAIGVFVTALPTGGLGIGLFFVLVSVYSWINKPAIFASVAVLNPIVKPAVYLASFQVGGFIIGSPSITEIEPAAETALIAIQQLLVGNVILAIVLSLVGYALVFHLSRTNRGRPRR